MTPAGAARPSIASVVTPAASTPRRLGRAAAWSRLGVPVALGAFAAWRLAVSGGAAADWILVAVAVVATAWRRSAPLAVLAVTGALALGLAGEPGALAAMACVAVALFNVAAHRSLPVAVGAAVVVEAGVGAVALGLVPGTLDRLDLDSLTGLVVASLLLGTTLRANARYLAAIELEHAQQEELAAAAERTRIAREMHDIVAHGLSVVITLSHGAASTVRTDPEEAGRVMQQVAGAARDSLTEMRRLLGVLREDDGDAPPRRPQPGLDRLPALFTDMDNMGLAVRLEREGDAGSLGPAAEATLFRIVQESLTNVIKHADGATVAVVRLRAEPGVVRFSIEDDGRGSRGAGAAAHAGRGLAGMRERVALYDGTLAAGPSAGRGWRVSGELRVG
jgi:signal transduction histidine kinase